MATAELTRLTSAIARNRQLHPATARTLLRALTAANVIVWAATAAGVAVGVIAPGLAPSGHPLPTLHGTPGETLGILATNLRVLAAPFLLALFRIDRSHAGRVLGDLLVVGLVLQNTLPVGVAIGRFGISLLPYLPQLPLEWLALSLSAMVWLRIRQSTSTYTVCVYAVAVIAVAASAAVCETLLTPHQARRTPAPGPRSSGQDRQAMRLTSVGVGGGLPAPRSCTGDGTSHFKVAFASFPSLRSVPLGRPPALPGFINHHPPQTEGTA